MKNRKRLLAYVMSAVMAFAPVAGAYASDQSEPVTEQTSEKNQSDTTGAVNSSISLPDGVYTPDKFSWSGGSGRVSITCNKITVSGGRAYATIVFSSDSYAYVKANGNKYTGTVSEGTTSFEIPVQLNANNTIVGMTTKMSAAHEITYQIFVYLKAADGEEQNAGSGMDDGAPEIAGLRYQSETKPEYAEYFTIYHYNDGIGLVKIDMENGTEQYLIVPENVEIPVGLEKEMILVQLPVERVCVASEGIMDIMKELGVEDLIAVTATEELNFAELVKSRCDLALLPAEFFTKEEDTPAEEMEYFEQVTSGFATLGIPMVIDRSSVEKTEEAKAEWMKVYELLFGCEQAE